MARQTVLAANRSFLKIWHSQIQPPIETTSQDALKCAPRILLFSNLYKILFYFSLILEPFAFVFFVSLFTAQIVSMREDSKGWRGGRSSGATQAVSAEAKGEERPRSAWNLRVGSGLQFRVPK